jgi:hypothetical protein
MENTDNVRFTTFSQWREPKHIVIPRKLAKEHIYNAKENHIKYKVTEMSEPEPKTYNELNQSLLYH